MADLVAAVNSGDRLASLKALASDLAVSLAESEISNRAALAKQLRDTLTEIEQIPKEGEVDALDELAARRTTPVPKRAASGRK